MELDEKRPGVGGIFHIIFAYVILFVWGISDIYRGLTRSVGMFSFPYSRRPVHIIILIAGVLEAALGIYRLVVRSRLIKDGGRSRGCLAVMFIMSAVHMVIWELLFRYYLDSPATSFRSGFWIQFAASAVVFCLIYLFYRNRKACLTI